MYSRKTDPGPAPSVASSLFPSHHGASKDCANSFFCGLLLLFDFSEWFNSYLNWIFMDSLMCMLSYDPMDGEEKGFNATKSTFPLQSVYKSTKKTRHRQGKLCTNNMQSNVPNCGWDHVTWPFDLDLFLLVFSRSAHAVEGMS